MTISIVGVQDSGHTVQYRAAYGNGSTIMVYSDRSIITPADIAEVERQVLTIAGLEYGSVTSWERMGGTDRQVRVATVQILPQLGQNDYSITWSSPMPSGTYAIDVGPNPVGVGQGTAAVLSQSAAGAVIRVNVTTLPGLLGGFTVVALY